MPVIISLAALALLFIPPVERRFSVRVGGVGIRRGNPATGELTGR